MCIYADAKLFVPTFFILFYKVVYMFVMYAYKT